MSKYIAILIEGDNENSLGGACSRDIWHITNKLINDLNVERNNIFTFFHSLGSDKYVEKLTSMGIMNITYNSLENIRKCYDFVVEQSKLSHVIVFFHYSGHGYQVMDHNGDEIDGMDEIFVGHQMTDDYVWEHLVSKLSESTHIFALVDACHAGSGMDMPYLWRNGKWVLHKKKNVDAKCHGFSLSACNDVQCASQDIGETTGFSGSLTAGVCDSGRLSEFIYDPIKLYNILIPRLQKLHQTVELYCVKI